jgi:hypothetical protein
VGATGSVSPDRALDLIEHAVGVDEPFEPCAESSVGRPDHDVRVVTSPCG